MQSYHIKYVFLLRMVEANTASELTKFGMILDTILWLCFGLPAVIHDDKMFHQVQHVNQHGDRLRC